MRSVSHCAMAERETLRRSASSSWVMFAARRRALMRLPTDSGAGVVLVGMTVLLTDRCANLKLVLLDVFC